MPNLEELELLNNELDRFKEPFNLQKELVRVEDVLREYRAIFAVIGVKFEADLNHKRFDWFRFEGCDYIASSGSGQ